MGYKQGERRDQAVLFPPRLDDYVSDSNPVRFIDAFVEALDMEGLGFGRSRPASTGRPPYDPRDLLKLLIYGYLNQITTSRRLERACHRNVEVMWLLKRLAPDFKTIADFRRDNRVAFKGVFREFNRLCREMELFGGELVAIDGSKFKADNHKEKNITLRRLEADLKRMDAEIDRYLDELERGDEAEADQPELSAEELQEKIRQLKRRREEGQQLRDEMVGNGEGQRSEVDPDSRRMTTRERVLVGYNVQIAVDARHHLIVAQEVTNEGNDLKQLSPLAIEAKEMLGVDRLDVVADAGYSSGSQVAACEREGITAYLPSPVMVAKNQTGLYPKERFRYDPELDGYWCPQGDLLTYRGDTRKNGRTCRIYKGTACAGCTVRPQCTRAKMGRRIQRGVNEDALERMVERMRHRPDMMDRRKALVEHPFGTIKFWWNQGHFLTRGLASVRAEFSLNALSYNIKRAMKVMGTDGMIRAIAQFKQPVLPYLSTSSIQWFQSVRIGQFWIRNPVMTAS